MADDDMTTRQGSLVAWVMQHVEEWERHRDQHYQKRWEEYYRIWRGVWAEEDKSRSSERSRLISPATQQAVESTVAEIEEAIFSRKGWFDIEDNYAERAADVRNPSSNSSNTQQMQALRHFMLERFDIAGVPANLARIFLNGALYGTGIGKVVTDEISRKRIGPTRNPVTGQVDFDVIDETLFLVNIEPIDPSNFVIDPAARTIEEAMGCAHIVNKPAHLIYERQQSGVYRDVPVGEANELVKIPTLEDRDEENTVKVVEYHGLVPRELIEGDDELDDEQVDEEDYVEAIITIGNDSALLRETVNPFWMGDRSIVAYQHDTVPDSFWGRGICEKGYNSQKALDAELRARMDGLALSVHPMMGIDVTRLPRGANFTVHPGKVWGTNGDPSQILKPFNFGEINPDTFRNAGDLERMVQNATGSVDPATPMNMQRRNSTASGISMALSAAVKRSRRTLQNIERNVLEPFLQKAAWRFMQFDREFPIRDLTFTAHASLGIMARELEQQQLTQLLQTVPPESEMFMILLKAIYDNSSLTNKDEMVAAVNRAMQPDQRQMAMQQMQTQLAIEKERAEIAERQARALETQTEARKNLAEINKWAADIDVEQDKIDAGLTKELLDLRAAQANKAGSDGR